MPRNAIVAEVVLGTESHDEYLEWSRVSVTVADDFLKYGDVEDMLIDYFLDWDPYGEGWVRIDSMARITL